MMTIRDMLDTGTEIEGFVRVVSYDGSSYNPTIQFSGNASEFDVKQKNNYLDMEIASMSSYVMDQGKGRFIIGICFEVLK